MIVCNYSNNGDEAVSPGTVDSNGDNYFPQRPPVPPKDGPPTFAPRGSGAQHGKPGMAQQQRAPPISDVAPWASGDASQIAPWESVGNSSQIAPWESPGGNSQIAPWESAGSSAQIAPWETDNSQIAPFATESPQSVPRNNGRGAPTPPRRGYSRAGTSDSMNWPSGAPPPARGQPSAESGASRGLRGKRLAGDGDSRTSSGRTTPSGHSMQSRANTVGLDGYDIAPWEQPNYQVSARQRKLRLALVCRVHVCVIRNGSSYLD
jgi:hypothetical protein